jgi:hypothetical protein
MHATDNKSMPSVTMISEIPILQLIAKRNILQLMIELSKVQLLQLMINLSKVLGVLIIKAIVTE